MTQKTITVEHPGAHSASVQQIEEAVKAAEGVGENYEISSYVNESGVQTKLVLTWDDPEPAQAEPKAARKG